METITEPLIVNVHLQADTSADLIYKLDLRMLDHRLSPNDKGNGLVSPEMFSDYKSKDIHVSLPAMTSSAYAFPTLFYRSRPLTGSISLTYCVRDENPQTEELAFVVTPRGPITGVVLGGILGVFALLLFRFAFQQARQTRSVITRNYVLQAASSAALGIAVVTIIVLILRLAPAQLDKLPVTVDVKDASGGFVTGLFFEPLANYLAERFWRSNKAQEAAASTEETARD